MDGGAHSQSGGHRRGWNVAVTPTGFLCVLSEPVFASTSTFGLKANNGLCCGRVCKCLQTPNCRRPATGIWRNGSSLPGGLALRVLGVQRESTAIG